MYIYIYTILKQLYYYYYTFKLILPGALTWHVSTFTIALRISFLIRVTYDWMMAAYVGDYRVNKHRSRVNYSFKYRGRCNWQQVYFKLISMHSNNLPYSESSLYVFLPYSSLLDYYWLRISFVSRFNVDLELINKKVYGLIFLIWEKL